MVFKSRKDGRQPRAFPFVWSLRYHELIIDQGRLPMFDDSDSKRFIGIRYCCTRDSFFLSIRRQLRDLRESFDRSSGA